MRWKGLASLMLSLPLPAETLTIRDLFPGQTAMFPLGSLPKEARQEFAACFSGGRSSKPENIPSLSRRVHSKAVRTPQLVG